MVPVLSAVCVCSHFFFFQTTGKLNCSLAYIVKPRLVFALLAVLHVDVRFAPRVTCTGSSSCRFCCCLVTVGGGVSPDVWPQLSDTPGGLTDSGGAMSGASPPTSQKDALPSSKPNKPSPPSSPSNRGQKEVSKVNGSVQEELSPSPMEVASKEQSKSGPPEKKKDPVGENCQVHPFTHHPHHRPHLSLSGSLASSVFMLPRCRFWISCFYQPFNALSSHTLSESSCGVYVSFLRLSSDKMFTGPLGWSELVGKIVYTLDMRVGRTWRSTGSRAALWPIRAQDMHRKIFHHEVTVDQAQSYSFLLFNLGLLNDCSYFTQISSTWRKWKAQNSIIVTESYIL